MHIVLYMFTIYYNYIAHNYNYAVLLSEMQVSLPSIDSLIRKRSSFFH